MTESTGPSRHDRILGALLGVHAGDSLGATVEFESWENIQREYPQGVRDIIGGGPFGWSPGHATDDTDLTRAVLLAYRETEETRRNPTAKKQPNVVKLSAQNMVDWYDGRWPGRTRGETPVDVGGATAAGIRRYKQTGDSATSGAGEGQAGNGSLMRCIPTALFQLDRSLLAYESQAISAITHNDFHCTIACVSYNAMVQALVHGKTPQEAYDEGERIIASCIPAGNKHPILALAAKRVGAAIEAGKSQVKVQDLAENGPQHAANASRVIPFKGAGYVLESLTIAVAALFDPRPLEDVLVDVVRFGKDTDTNGAIAGGLLGARDGVGAIPERWREKLQFGKEFIDVVDYMLSGEQ